MGLTLGREDGVLRGIMGRRGWGRTMEGGFGVWGKEGGVG